MQSVCQNKHVMKQEEAVREDLPLSLQMEYKKCMRRARNEQSEFWSKTTYVPAAGVDPPAFYVYVKDWQAFYKNRL